MEVFLLTKDMQTMRFTKPGMSEHSLAAHFEYLCALNGSQRPAYVPVVASGSAISYIILIPLLISHTRPNARIIHNTSNNQIIQDGEMILMDAACEYK